MSGIKSKAKCMDKRCAELGHRNVEYAIESENGVSCTNGTLGDCDACTERVTSINYNTVLAKQGNIFPAITMQPGQRTHIEE